MMSMTTGRSMTCIVAALAVLGTPVLEAQQDRPSFRSNARLVELSVVVMDRGLNPVTGLSKDDFQVFDDGKLQKAELFLIEGSSPAAPRTATAPPPDPREFSNKEVDRGSVTIILYDQFNTPPQVLMRVRAHVARFLEQIRPDDRVGLYVLDPMGSLRVVHDFTSDTASLVRAVSRLRGNMPMPLAGAADAARLEADLARLIADDVGSRSASGEMRAHFDGLRGVGTIDALESIGRYLAGIQKRKNLIWVSAGFPVSFFDKAGVSKTREINRATRALNDANVALYTVDARGLIPTLTGVPGEQTFTTLSMVAANQDILQSVAEDTGGRAFLNTNDIQGAVRRATDDARMTYVLGYYPIDDVWDGRFHRIDVKVRRPELEVRHRKGYFAVATEKQATAQRVEALEAAVRSPLDASGLGMTVRINPVPGKSAEYLLTVHVEAGAITLERRGDDLRGALDVIVAQIGADGAVARSLDHRADILVPGKRLEQFLRDGASFDHTVTLTPDTERLRVVVRDVRTGALGAIGVSRQRLQALAR